MSPGCAERARVGWRPGRRQQMSAPTTAETAHLTARLWRPMSLCSSPRVASGAARLPRRSDMLAAAAACASPPRTPSRRRGRTHSSSAACTEPRRRPRRAFARITVCAHTHTHLEELLLTVRSRTHTHTHRESHLRVAWAGLRADVHCLRCVCLTRHALPSATSLARTFEL